MRDELTAAELKTLWSFKKQDDADRTSAQGRQKATGCRQSSDQGGALIITNYKGDSAEITIPDRIGKNIVTAIAESALSPAGPRKSNPEVLRKITKVTLPDTIKFIGKEAFWGCENLTEINIPDGVEEISESAFFRCKSLKSITIPDSVKIIGTSAFTGCENLKQINLPNGITEIASNTFSSCRSLETVKIPDSVTKINKFAFKFCDNLKSVIIPPSVTIIENEKDSSGKTWTVFHSSPNVTAIVKPNSYAEQYCKRNEIKYKYSEAE